jgi:hypothetical protein
LSNIAFLKNHPIQVNGRSTAALIREPLMLQATVLTALFNIVNSVSWLKEYSLPLSIFMGKEHQFCAK